jgi:hypothetical protein
MRPMNAFCIQQINDELWGDGMVLAVPTNGRLKVVFKLKLLRNDFPFF